MASAAAGISSLHSTLAESLAVCRTSLNIIRTGFSLQADVDWRNFDVATLRLLAASKISPAID